MCRCRASLSYRQRCIWPFVVMNCVVCLTCLCGWVASACKAYLRTPICVHHMCVFRSLNYPWSVMMLGLLGSNFLCHKLLLLMNEWYWHGMLPIQQNGINRGFDWARLLINILWGKKWCSYSTMLNRGPEVLDATSWLTFKRYFGEAVCNLVFSLINI